MPGTQWQKSSFSGVEGENCVELAAADGHLLLRESDDPDTVITTTPARLNALVRWQKARALFAVADRAALGVKASRQLIHDIEKEL